MKLPDRTSAIDRRRSVLTTVGVLIWRQKSTRKNLVLDCVVCLHTLTVVLNSFCNSTTMAWNCGCKHKTADFQEYLWPVVEAECSGKAQACQGMCNAGAKDRSTCADACTRYYECATELAPPSFLQTDSVTDTPSYVQRNTSTKGNTTMHDATNAKSSQAWAPEVAWAMSLALIGVGSATMLL
ncbi:hypothetical protein BCR43DRAFT_228572 [Syncephalastrum racemosum]|uniref:Uncharacterized protein n=1 Tax=Syncephalastrum racemosum TaxID=13706 RepID=A0A1X2HJY8_SYNRA|nr:hypothetical protein BCR43DRAFT_228572 [Syncephalastrum racemosum]